MLALIESNRGQGAREEGEDVNKLSGAAKVPRCGELCEQRQRVRDGCGQPTGHGEGWFGWNKRFIISEGQRS